MSTSSVLCDPVTGDVIGVGVWSVENHPAAAAQATITQAAAGPGIKNVCKSITVAIAANATPQTPLRAYLRDGASGVGAILWSGVISVPAGWSNDIEIEVDIPGSPNTAMTLEFEGAAVAGALSTVAMT